MTLLSGYHEPLPLFDRPIDTLGELPDRNSLDTDHSDDTSGDCEMLHQNSQDAGASTNQQFTGNKMLNGSNAGSTYIVADKQSNVNSYHPNINTSMKGRRTEHVLEWMEGSGISKEITALNLVSMDSREARMMLNWEGKGEGLSDGWWCGSVNPVTGETTDFGQYKPDKPYEFSNKSRRAVKYLSPRKTKTEAIYLRMPKPDYWRGVLEDCSQEVHITEGVKKAAAELSMGYPTIALVGVWNGQQAKGRELIDSLKAFAQPGRTFVFTFDADLSTNMQVRAALDQLGNLLISRGCHVRVAQWSLYHGKGIDDLKVNQGDIGVENAVNNAVSFDQWLETETHEMPSPQTITGKVWNYVKTAMANKLQIDEFSLEYRYGGKELVMAELQAKISEINGTDVSLSYLTSAVHHFARQNPYSDVREYLRNMGAIHPDAKGYIRQLVDMMGLQKDTEKLLVFKWLVGAVARAIEPGCKFDSVLIQKSVEGLGKTHLMSVLAGEEKFYEVTADPSNKDFRQLTVNFWILELGEIEATFRKSDISALKSYITQKMDAFRPPYLRKTEKFPRHFIFCGSTNSDTVITDPDGIRRWWVVEPTKKFDIDWVRQHRDLIWAEAYRHYTLGEPLYLNDVQIEAFKAHAQQYRQTRDFYEGLVDILPDLKKQPFTSARLLEATFNIYSGSKGYKTRLMDLAQDLKLLGFENRECRVNGIKGRYWHYIGSDDEPNHTLNLPF